MSGTIDNSLILKEIKKYYNFKRNTDFAAFIGIAPNTLSNWISRNTLDYHLIYTKCVDINPEWLLTGKGPMLKIHSGSSQSQHSTQPFTAQNIFQYLQSQEEIIASLTAENTLLKQRLAEKKD